MKMKPAQRNAIKAVAENAEREIKALERSLAKLKPGSLPHQRLSLKLQEAQESSICAKSRLAHTTQPNRGKP